MPIVAFSATADDDAHASFVDDGAKISIDPLAVRKNIFPGGNFDPCTPP